MTPTLKKTRRGKTWPIGMLYCISLVLVIGLGGYSPAWAMRACPATGSEWNELAMEINDVYKDTQEAARRIDAATPLIVKSIKRFDRKATRWMKCLTKFMHQPDAPLSPDRALDAALVRTQADLIDGLVRYAETCVRKTDVTCDRFEGIQVVFSSLVYDEEARVMLTSSLRGNNPFGNTWDNFLSVVGF